MQILDSFEDEGDIWLKNVCENLYQKGMYNITCRDLTPINKKDILYLSAHSSQLMKS
jgi:hypothetical protein